MRLLIVRLSPFAVAERSSTHLVLAYEARRGSPRAYVDMLFFPPVGGLASVHGSRSPREFDLLLLSNAYLLELVNVPRFLEQSGIPAEAEDRGDADPIVILGGASAMAASPLVEPLRDGSGGWAGYVDAFFFGEGEGEVGRIAAAWERRRGEGRRAVLAAMAEEVAALWVPPLPGESAARPPRRAVLDSVGIEDVPTDYPVLDGEEAATARLQITYGCPALCSFCFESYDRRPYREVPAEVLLGAARLLKLNTGARRLELYSFNFSYHSAFPTLVLELGRLFGAVGFMSQRIDVLARNPELLAYEIAAGKRSYTLGIEGVSERLRSFLRKGIAAEDLEAVLLDLVRRRVRELKLFYIITGYEEEADLAELGAFLSRIRRERFPAGGSRIILSATWLLRMPFTPLRGDPPLLDRARAEGIARAVERVAAERGIEFRLAGRWEEHVICQLLASGGHAARSLVAAICGSGATYDGELSPRAWPVVERWMEANAEVMSRITGGSAPADGHAFDFVGGSPEAGRLDARYREALESLGGSRHEPPLGFAPSHQDLDSTGMEALVRARGVAERSAVSCVVRTGPETAGAGPEWLGSWLMRELLRSVPALVDQILGVDLVVPAVSGEWDVAWYGMAVARVSAWESGVIAELARAGTGPLVSLAPHPAAADFRELGARVVVRGAGVRALRAAMDAFAASIRCPVLTTRDGEGYAFSATTPARKRRSFLAGGVRGEPGGSVVDLVVGPRFPMRAFVRSLPGAGARSPAVEITAISF